MAGLDDQLTAARHGVARIDREVEQRVLDLARINDGRAQALGKLSLGLALLSPSPPQERAPAPIESGEVGRFGGQRLAPSESEQAIGELRAELGGALRLLDE